jgi:hypothetical protein
MIAPDDNDENNDEEDHSEPTLTAWMRPHPRQYLAAVRLPYLTFRTMKSCGNNILWAYFLEPSQNSFVTIRHTPPSTNESL